jgi:hypothetical protein
LALPLDSWTSACGIANAPQCHHVLLLLLLLLLLLATDPRLHGLLFVVN